MAVAQIPGRPRAVIHDAIIMLRIGNEPRILHRIHETLAVALGVCVRLCRRSVSTTATSDLAGRISAGQRGMAVSGGIGLPWRQAAISRARNPGGGRIDFIEISQNRADRIVKAVQIESMKGGARFGFERTRCACAANRRMLAPLCCATSRSGIAQRRSTRMGIFEVTNVVIDTRGIRPIALRSRQNGNLSWRSVRARSGRACGRIPMFRGSPRPAAQPVRRRFARVIDPNCAVSIDWNGSQLRQCFAPEAPFRSL